MATETVRVNVRHRVESGRAISQTERLAEKAERYAREADKAEKLTRRWSATMKLFGTGVATAGLGFLSRKLVQVQSSAENASIKIAGIFATLNPKQGFLRSLERARDLVERFQDLSITSPATSAQFEELFQEAAPALGGLGLNNRSMAGFISRAVPAALAFSGGDYAQAGRDINQLLSGNFGTDNRTFNPMRARLLELTKTKDTQQFNKLAKAAPAKIFAAVQKALESMDDVNIAYATTFTGLVSSSEEFLTRFGRSFSDPLFEQIKAELIELVEWFQKNEDAVRRVARQVGDRLASGFKLAAAGAKLLLQNMEGIAALATILAAKRAGGMLLGAGGGIGGSIASGVASYVGGGAALGGRAARAIGAAPGAAIWGLARRGGLYDRARAIPGRMGALPARGRAGIEAFRTAGAGVLNRHGGTISGVLAGGLKGGVVKAMGLFKAMGVGLLKLGVIVLPLVVVIGMLAGMFRVLKDKTNEATTFLHASIEELLIALDMITIQFGGSGGFVKTVKDFADWLGTGVVGVMGIAVKAIEQLVRAISWMGAVIQGVALGVGKVMSVYEDYGIRAAFDPGLLKNAFSKGMDEAFANRDAAEREAYRKRKAEQDKNKKDEDEKAKNDLLKKTKPNVNVTVNQKVETNADPDRIAFKTGEAVKQVMTKDRNVAAALFTGLERPF